MDHAFSPFKSMIVSLRLFHVIFKVFLNGIITLKTCQILSLKYTYYHSTQKTYPTLFPGAAHETTRTTTTY